MHAALTGESISIRNPDATRPWQHVLNPLSGYLELAQALVASAEHQGGWNFGPAGDDLRPVRWSADRISERWGASCARSTPGDTPMRRITWRSTRQRPATGSGGYRPGSSARRSTLLWLGIFTRREGGDMREETLVQIHSFAEAHRKVSAR